MTTQTKPIEAYSLPTPNGQKVHIMLEELGVPWNYHRIDIGKGEQFTPEFLAISPNNKIPAIVDPEGPDGQPISIFESGAILKYLGLKFGQFYPTDPRQQVKVDEWLFWQVGGFGPMLGQNNHFNVYAPEKLPYAQKRYSDETHRLFRVLNIQLAGRPPRRRTRPRLGQGRSPSGAWPTTRKPKKSCSTSANDHFGFGHPPDPLMPPLQRYPRQRLQGLVSMPA
jgi:glutathione S-transferase